MSEVISELKRVTTERTQLHAGVCRGERATPRLVKHIIVEHPGVPRGATGTGFFVLRGCVSYGMQVARVIVIVNKVSGEIPVVMMSVFLEYQLSFGWAIALSTAGRSGLIGCVSVWRLVPLECGRVQRRGEGRGRSTERVQLTWPDCLAIGSKKESSTEEELTEGDQINNYGIDSGVTGLNMDNNIKSNTGGHSERSDRSETDWAGDSSPESSHSELERRITEFENRRADEMEEEMERRNDERLARVLDQMIGFIGRRRVTRLAAHESSLRRGYRDDETDAAIEVGIYDKKLQTDGDLLWVAEVTAGVNETDRPAGDKWTTVDVHARGSLPLPPPTWSHGGSRGSASTTKTRIPDWNTTSQRNSVTFWGTDPQRFDPGGHKTKATHPLAVHGFRDRATDEKSDGNNSLAACAKV